MILANCTAAAGTRRCLDIKPVSRIGEIVTIPVIASGGAGKVEHFLKVLEKTFAGCHMVFFCGNKDRNGYYY
jgi:cyclase